jgi:hypothetical protein
MQKTDLRQLVEYQRVAVILSNSSRSHAGPYSETLFVPLQDIPLLSADAIQFFMSALFFQKSFPDLHVCPFKISACTKLLPSSIAFFNNLTALFFLPPLGSL